MKEIKFRVWNVIEKKMLDWGDIFDKKAREIFPGTPEQGPYQVMQYTGLKDKNGKEIYEFDYLEYKGELYKIFFNKYKISLENISKKDIIDLTDEILSDLSIKGNIYEN